ncbi:UDP-glucose 4-epimerase [Polymorphobacter glacialis]|uniref:UDP-glucose 4-epimerase n=1 Tax=Sandarakinorhabdus glacialis TaxID=1614636 RepID=A0A917E731_9SPHN|nr:GDP-mannose 4,6-dehydratase [Polymorphobacter glacialis]GGE09748.1 UDP-glucose 4-epimerase [Polymorphobacter glacialis]
MRHSERGGEPLRALVTGIDSFTGPFIETELRQRGFEVYGTFHGSSTGVHRSDIDLRDPDAITALVAEIRPSHVIHLAAISFVATRDVESIYLTNIMGTRNLLSALTAADSHRPHSVIIASSANIYGNSPVSPLDETSEARPENDYAISKHAVENLARIWSDRLPVTIVRPFNYTGRGQSERFLVPKIVAAFRKRVPNIELGNLDVYRDFSDVRDIAAAYAGLADACCQGVFNLCSGSIHSIDDILRIARQITGHDLNVSVNPDFVRANEIKTLVGSNQRLCAALPEWSSRSFEHTLRWMLVDGLD